MEEITFEEMESKVINHSIAYQNSEAFRRALHYFEEMNLDFYKELIETEYYEAFS